MQEIPTVQLLFLFLINAGYLAILKKYEPYEKKLYQKQKELAEIIYNVATFLMIFVSLLGSETVEANAWDRVFGWPIAILFRMASPRLKR